MAEGAIDSISIEIGASSTKAVEDIKKLAQSLKELKTAQQAVKSGNSGTKNTFQNISDSSVQAMSKIDLLRKKLDILKQDLNKKMALGKIDDKGIVNSALQIKSVESQIAKASGKSGMKASFNPSSDLMTNLKQIGKDLKGNINVGMQAFGSALKSAAGYAKSIAKSILSFAGKQIKGIWDKSAFAGLEKSLGRIRNVINSFSRIAFYRAIRSAIKYVTDALKEGVENAYHYSREYGEATSYIADAYDRISSSEFKMSNQLGAAWATMIAYIEPIIIRIINLVTRAADAVTQFFAILSGKGTYLKATDYNKKWADSATGAAKAAEEWKNQLMGFDEINRLEEPSDGGGGGGGNAGLDYGDMFEETAKNEFFEQIRDAFENGQWALMGQLLGEKFDEIVDMVDWKKYGKKLGAGLNASITVAYNFLKTADFKNLGVRISEFINNALEQVNFDQAGRTWMRLRLSLLDFLIGIADGLDWRMLAIKLSNFVIGSLDELAEWLRNLDTTSIANAMKDFFGNIKYKEIGDKIAEVLKLAFGDLGDVVKELLPEGLGDNVRDGIVDAIKNTDFATIHNVLMYKLDEAVFGPKWADFWWNCVHHGEYSGKEIINGLIQGVDGGKQSLESSLDNGLKKPVNQAMGEVELTTGQKLGNIVSKLEWFSSQMGLASLPFGRFLADGRAALSALDSDVFSFGRNIIDNFRTIAQAAAETWNYIRSGGGVSLFGGKITIGAPAHAEGGFPEDGLFYANHGELVGKFSNGRTAVANNEQIVAGISAGVFDAVVAAFAQSGGGSDGNDRPVNIYLDGKLIAQSTTKYQTQFARARG